MLSCGTQRRVLPDGHTGRQTDRRMDRQMDRRQGVPFVLRYEALKTKKVIIIRPTTKSNQKCFWLNEPISYQHVNRSHRSL